MESSSGPPPGAIGAPSTPVENAPPTTPSSGLGPRLRERISTVFTWLGFDPPGRWLALLTVFVVLDIVVLSWIQIVAYNSFYTFSQDFGSFSQIFYTTVHYHTLLYYTSNIPAGSNGTFMAVHFSPLIFLLLPFYALAPAPTTLLVMKIVALAAGAFPAYGIAHRRLGSPRWGLLLGTVYLVSPITMTLNWIDFDMEVFIPFFVLCALYLLIRKRYFAFLVAWVLALATIETAVPFLLIFGILALLGSYWGSGMLSRQNRSQERVALWMSVLLAAAWLGIAYFAVHSYSPVGGTFGTSYARSYYVLQAQSFYGIIPQAILHPGLAGLALSFNGSNKIAYLLLLFGCFAFLPLFGELRYLVPVAAWIGLAVLSNTPQEYSFGSQYLGYVSPFLFAGAVGGIVLLRPWVATHLGTQAGTAGTPAGLSSRARPWTLPRSEEAIIPGIVIVAAIVTVGVGNPLLDHPVAGLPAIEFGFPSPSAHTALLDRIIALIPPNAGVLTTDHVFPQLADREHAYVLPTEENFVYPFNYPNSLALFMNPTNTTYVLLDFTLDPFPSELIQYFGNWTGWGIEASGSGIFLLAYGWTGPEKLGYSGPIPSNSPASEWATKSKGVSINPGNQTFEYPVPSTGPAKSNVSMWNGPQVSRIVPGVYILNMTYILAPSTVGPLFNVQVSEVPNVVTPVPTNLTAGGAHYSYTFTTPGQPQALGSTQVNGTAAELGKQTGGVVSITFEVDQLGKVYSQGITLAGKFWMLVTGFTLTWVGPPSSFYTVP
jgi:uncharacterized membrane protein